MTRFFIVRHGETKGTEKGRYHGSLDMPLSAAGRKQAKNLKSLFDESTLDYIYASPLKRCLQTADIIKGKRGVPVRVSENLREIYFGKWEGLTLNQMYKKNPGKLKSWMKNFSEFHMPRGEKVMDMVKRTKKFWKYVTAKHKSGNILIVTHGGPAKTIIIKTLGLSLKQFWSFQIDTCSVSVVDYDGNYAIVKTVNNQLGKTLFDPSR